jgi:hypothetical protein
MKIRKRRSSCDPIANVIVISGAIRDLKNQIIRLILAARQRVAS